MRGLRSTVLLFVVLVGLGAYIYFKEWKTASLAEVRASRPRVLTAAPETIEEVTVRSVSGDTTTLTKAGEAWRITAPVAAETDETAASAITRDLGNLEIRHVVDENPSDLKPYGLDPPRVEVIVKTSGDAQPKHVLIGDKTPAGENLYTKLASEKRVLLIAASFDETFNKTTWDLQDRRVLQIDRLQIDSLEVAGPDQKVALVKRDLDWHLTQPLQTAGDLGVVSELIAKLTAAQMQSLAAPEATQLAKYGLDKPVHTVTVGTGSSRATLHVGSRADESRTYARDVSRPLVFTIETMLADELKKPLADYRRKDVFHFAAHDARRMELTRKGRTTIYERVENKTAGATRPTWREVSPQARDIEADIMDTALSRLSLLRAVTFVDSSRIKARLASPDVAVLVRYGDSGQDERVRLASVGNAPYAARAEWRDAATLAETAYVRVIEALDALPK
jgi:hypothetical protein